MKSKGPWVFFPRAHVTANCCGQWNLHSNDFGFGCFQESTREFCKQIEFLFETTLGVTVCSICLSSSCALHIQRLSKVLENFQLMVFQFLPSESE